MNVTCVRCGESKPVDSFRKYPANRGGHYKYCSDCERVEHQYKYLVKLGDKRSDKQTETLHKIERLYAALLNNGLEVPKIYKKQTEQSHIDKLLDKYGGDYEAIDS